MSILTTGHIVSKYKGHRYLYVSFKPVGTPQMWTAYFNLQYFADVFAMCAITGGFLPTFQSKQEFESLFHALQDLFSGKYTKIVFKRCTKYLNITEFREESKYFVGWSGQRWRWAVLVPRGRKTSKGRCCGRKYRRTLLPCVLGKRHS